jgi:bifunctional DNase/RNase
VNKIKLDILGLSSSQSQTGSFALVLGEENGNRRLPIIIGMFEAQAIAIEIEKIEPNRPMTHDLFKFFAEKFNFTIEEIFISEFREGIFFAKIVSTDGKRTVEIDARPSDAIAIGLRFGVPIYTTESILSEAGIILSDSEEDKEDDELEESHEVVESKVQKTKEELIKEMSVDQLNGLLEEAITNEDYERAAFIRDEINKRN